MKYKPNSVSVVFGAIFVIMGMIFLGAIIAVDISYANQKNSYVPVEAVITDIREEKVYDRSRKTTKITHEVIVKYEYEGNTYRTHLGHYNSAMNVGDREEIYIDPEAPGNTVSSPLTLNLIIIPMVIIVMGLGIAFIIREIKRSKAVNKLIEEDMYIFCDNVIEEQSNTTVNNVRYLWLRCKYYANGQTYDFKSHPYHPRDSRYVPGQKVKIYVDLETNPKVYYMVID